MNVLPPMTSIYRWQGTAAGDTEWQVIIKTTRDRVDAVRGGCPQLHPYELPEFVVVAVETVAARHIWMGQHEACRDVGLRADRKQGGVTQCRRHG